MTGKIQVHRFHDRVAICPPHGDTFYLERKESRELWRAIQSVESELMFGVKFNESKVGTVVIDGESEPECPQCGCTMTNFDRYWRTILHSDGSAERVQLCGECEEGWRED